MFEVEEMTAGVRYDYSSDAIWSNLKEELERRLREAGIPKIEQALKEREADLRALFKKSEIIYDIDETTGEEFLRQAPTIKAGKNTLRFTLKHE
jgi:hypothetical protein